MRSSKIAIRRRFNSFVLPASEGGGGGDCSADGCGVDVIEKITRQRLMIWADPPSDKAVPVEGQSASQGWLTLIYESPTWKLQEIIGERWRIMCGNVVVRVEPD